ncbi:hypothetical protein AXF42_Ash009253 [Apostasia shenzhenica]|uniref:Uncharacterized protein n=1 Tax=Apostasia shenzhenica TaxID=1088818 RepID=A0A2I0B3K7_9ASPA|nr:hypothetical protein AXF42_Ash009253 [Apostasia shenzhenica]
MAGSTRAELASGSLDGSNFSAGYPNGPRGAYSSPNLERPGSFRESLDSRMMVSGPAASRNASTSEIPPLSQFLLLEPFSTSELNLKYSRQGELRRALGVSVEEHSFGSLQSKCLPPIASEELKRFRTSVQETSSRARERAKLLQESMVKLDKYRNIVMKRRQRNEGPSSEKSGSSNLLKMGNQINQNSTDMASPRFDERTKNAVPNKRVRSSMAEVRVCIFLSWRHHFSEVFTSPMLDGRNTIQSRQAAMLEKDKSMLFDKDKTTLRACNGSTMLTEDKMHGLPTGGDGWEKKLKRKRSFGTVASRVLDGDRELKQSIQQKTNIDPRSRPPDGLGFRAGSATGIIGNSKLDNNPQFSGGNTRILPRNDTENCSVSGDRRERVIGPDKERTVAKGNKLGIREDAHLGSQSPLSKGKASRAPRSGSSTMVNTPNFPRLSGGIEGWEQSSCLNKVQSLTGAINRKRPLSAGSASPPVAQWVGQRPQKMSRTRRVNVVSPVSNFDDTQASPEGFAISDMGTRVPSVDSGGSLNSRGVANGNHQLKIKVESIPSPAALSESEESGILENKREKGPDNGGMEDGAAFLPSRLPAFVPTKKNKLPPREEIGDGVRRQGRSGRVSVQCKASFQLTKEKPENVDSAKPLKSGRPTLEKSESRVGRPPSKKVSERKAYGRPGQSIHGNSELIGESEDDREELLTAVNSARNSCYNACSSSFWKKMEIVFTLIKFSEELDESLSNILNMENHIVDENLCEVAASPSFSMEQITNSNFMGMNKFIERICSSDERQPVKATSGKAEAESWFHKIIPLSQRLLSAFIDDDDNVNFGTEQGDLSLHFSRDYLANGKNTHFDNGLQLELTRPEFEHYPDCNTQKNYPSNVFPCNGFSNCGNFMSSIIQTSTTAHEPLQDNISREENTGPFTEHGQSNSRQFQCADVGFVVTSPYECQFELASLNDRILMELHSIGVYPEMVPDLAEGEDVDIDKVVYDLKVKLFQQVRKKKSVLYKLEKALQGFKEDQERNLEQLAMHKLLEVAYKKLLGGKGSHASSHKSGVSKTSKQLAQSFAKRTLIRCRKFEESGQSCFGEPFLRDALFSVLKCCFDARYFDGITLNNSERNCHQLEMGQFSSIQGFNDPSELPFVRNEQVNRVKKKEALLDDVVTSAASRALLTHCNTVPGAPKLKKTDKDKDQGRDALARNSGTKSGRPTLSSGRGERKTKTKPKQKIAQLSSSGNGLGRVTESNTLASREYSEAINIGGNRIKNEVQPSGNIASDISKEIEDTIFTNLPLNGMSIDELDVADGLGGQGQDIGSWLNVDEDALQDHDLVGLQIPMDDLSELKLNF